MRLWKGKHFTICVSCTENWQYRPICDPVTGSCLFVFKRVLYFVPTSEGNPKYSNKWGQVNAQSSLTKTSANRVHLKDTGPKTPSANFPQDAPLLNPVPNILFPSCVKIKPWESSDQKLQWNVSPPDALPWVCGVIRSSRWPKKNSSSFSTSTATRETRLPELRGSGSAR